MSLDVKKDSLLMIVGVSVLAGAFLLGVHLPGRKSSARLKLQIEAAEQRIRSVPLSVAELQNLQRKVERREAFLGRMDEVIPRSADVQGVLHQVAMLAERAEVRVTRLEPLSPVQQESYRTVPFHASLSGSFQGMAQFLHGLEGRRRLFTVQELSLRRDAQPATKETQADVYFSVYVRRTEEADSADSDASSDPRPTDTKS